mgnify:CR=1 FL=1|tara:strand:+ start:490 stop:1542 length:1053 start_codon:yes stop_codon:yes gene_type:complete
MNLTSEQQSFINKNYSITQDLIELTRQAFKDDTLDGRSKEGRAVRQFLMDNDLNYNTTKREKVPDVHLSSEQESFIKQYSGEGMNSLEIAKLIFPPEVEIKKLGKEQRVVISFLEENAPELVVQSENALTSSWAAPRTVDSIVGKVNQYCAEKINIKKTTKSEEECLDRLIVFLASPRFIWTINNYSDQRDRDLFEAEFIRATWDKPDLNTDEINLYINVCIDYINLKNINKHIEKLNKMFDDLEEENEMTVRLAEVLKAKSTEYDQCEKRQQQLISSLNGDRVKRIATKIDKNSSILALVQAFQNEEDRRFMVQMAEKQKLDVQAEADRIESVESWKARVLGIDKSDII